MRRVFLINLNVGSAIEYAGNILKHWLISVPETEVFEYKHQTMSHHTLEALINFKPQLIVVNEFYPRIIDAVSAYKLIDPDCKIIFINHVWRDLFIDHPDCPAFHSFFLNKCSAIFCLNKMPVDQAAKFDERLYNYHYPADPHIFKVSTPWSDRKLNFCYIGNILPHKIHPEFLKKITATDISIDCYGRRFDTDPAYNELFDNCPNMKFHGQLDQLVVAETFNKYKYFILPHNGYEPFNFTVLQSAFCGTIPIILNDKKSTVYNGKWLDWADGLYLGCADLDQYIENLVNIKHDMQLESTRISFLANREFDYKVMQREFSEVVFWALQGDR